MKIELDKACLDNMARDPNFNPMSMYTKYKQQMKKPYTKKKIDPAAKVAPDQLEEHMTNFKPHESSSQSRQSGTIGHHSKWNEVKSRFKDNISINSFDNYQGVMTCY